VQFHDIKGETYDLMVAGLMSRIFQHEMDHLNGELMWAEIQEKSVPRRLDQSIDISEVERDPATFYKENEKFIFEF
jgi:peptide deformylase